jgi:hypothetical protein
MLKCLDFKKYPSRDINPLKVHKNENFFGFDFEFFTVSLLVMLKYDGLVKTIFDWATMGGGRIIPRSLKTMGIKIVFNLDQLFLFI